MNFSDRLIELRSERGLTQQKFGDLLNITRSTIASYEKENREPKYDILITIAKFFNVSIDYLLGYTNIRSYNNPTPFTSTLSEKQDKLLDLFDSLNESNQGALIERATMLLEDQEKQDIDSGIYKKNA
ncbi:helix-turn-helix domain-containing protein [Anaerovorax sp. IOR16]|uniref:helix-turn-helix domain-containing protein n=1 Tax=Anaerovorax sp. IOR16 TaxID=2773458 RepID=UPI0019CFA354|nr:helix-turn-helix transcriptional regulator [Anaerovorax sp. IOR16]